MKLNLTDAVVAVDSRLYEAGYTDDGQPFIAESYFVTVHVECGKRWQHHQHWASTKPEWNDEDGCWSFPNLREEAREKAHALASRIIQRGVIDLAHWDEVDPVYGSTEYQLQGCELERVFQERNDLSYNY